MSVCYGKAKTGDLSPEFPRLSPLDDQRDCQRRDHRQEHQRPIRTRGRVMVGALPCPADPRAYALGTIARAAVIPTRTRSTLLFLQRFRATRHGFDASYLCCDYFCLANDYRELIKGS